jgi:hypothetical protein
LYGLINKAVHGYLQNNYGEEAWKKIAGAVGVHHYGFISLETYPDELTYDLVMEASHTLAVSPEYILEGLGEYWITFTAFEGYGDFFARHNKNIIEFLEHLNAMHVRLMLLHPEMRIPKFELNKQSTDAFDLHYFSERKGLAPMVKGLLTGLSKKFSQPIAIEHVASSLKDGNVHEVFHIKLLPLPV